jgi:hypothetical protein
MFCFAQRSKTWFSSFVPVKVKQINYKLYTSTLKASVVAKSKLFISVHREKQFKEAKAAQVYFKHGRFTTNGHSDFFD